MSRRVSSGVRSCGVALLTVAALCAPVVTQAQTTVVLRAADSESIDTTIRGGSYSSTNLDGQVLATRADTYLTNARRTLLKFNTETRIPKSATIQSARLTLTVRGGNTETRTLSAYRLKTSFDERVATWRMRKSSIAWASAGGDLASRYATASATGTAGSKVTFDVTRLVQEIVRGTYEVSRWTRIAIVDTGTASAGSYREFYSSESSDASVRPTLTVVYGGTTSTSTSTSTGTSASGTTLRVLHWNTHHGIGTDGRYDPYRIAAWIARMNPQVASLNEVDTLTQVTAIVSSLRSRTGVTWYTSFSGRGNLVISRLPLTATSRCRYPSDDRHSAHLGVLVNGRPIHIWSTHLTVSSATARLNEIRGLQACATNWPEARILAGDFNMQAGSTEYNQAASTYIDAWAAARAAGRAINYSGNCDGCTRNSRIDYIFASRGASFLSLQSAQIYDTRDSNGVMPSDHKPMVVTYTVR